MAEIDVAVPVLLTLPEVAPVLRKSERTMQRWVASNAFPIETREICGRLYVRTVDLEDYIGRPVTVDDLRMAS